MSHLPYREVLESISPYVPGKPIEDVKREFGLSRIIKLASNENPYGASPLVKKVLLDEYKNPAIYPDPNCTLLRNELVARLNIKPGQLIFGAGSNEIISLIAQVFLNAGDESVFASPSFVWYDIAVKTVGAVPVKVPLKDNTHDLEAMKSKITNKTKVIWICNPNNPTGTIITRQQQEKFLSSIPSNIVVVLDEAYYEYVTDPNYPDSLNLLDKYPNLIVLRTFSKAYGLASLRIGYGITCKETSDYINRIRPPFNVNTVAQLAAYYSLNDEEFVSRSTRLNRKEMSKLYKEYKKLGLTYVPSQTNFIWVRTPLDSKEMFTRLMEKGIIIRPFMDRWLRITVGTSKENSLLIEALKEILK